MGRRKRKDPASFSPSSISVKRRGGKKRNLRIKKNQQKKRLTQRASRILAAPS